MLFPLVARRLAVAGRRMSTVAAATVDASDAVPAYVLEAPAAAVTTLDNGVTVASSYGADGAGGPSYATARISRLGARFDTIGGEAALLAASLGGAVGREHLSLPRLAPLAPPAHLDDLRAALAAKLAGASLESQALDHLHATAFQTSPAGDALKHALEGTPETLADVTAEDVARLAAGVRGGDVVVAGTGTGTHAELVERAEAAYGGLAGGGGGGEVGRAGVPSAFLGSDVRIRYDSHSTATVALAFKGASWTDPNALALELMRTILGSFAASSGLGKHVASSMCQEVADHKLASSISAFNLHYSDAGLFGIVATAPDNKLDDLLWYVMPNLVRLAHGVSDEELVRAKRLLRTRVLAEHDGDVARGEGLARGLQTAGRVVPLAETLARCEALTLEDVKAAADAVINDQDHALAAIGGVHELPDYNWIRRHSYMLRY